MTVCDKHRRNPVRVYHQCIGCELDGYRDRIEQLTRECDEARAVMNRMVATVREYVETKQRSAEECECDGMRGLSELIGADANA
jgi:uncharacterized protein with ATP-grasp and redox domains